MKKYTRPEFDINLFSSEDIITVSGEGGYTNALTTWQAANNGAQLTKAKMDELSQVTKFVF